MRGKGKAMTGRCAASGITPAYAGKSRCSNCTSSNRRDHPRLCGEKRSRPRKAGLILGSPPPMRGKVNIKNATHATHRITPAYAGKSLSLPVIIKDNQDHPRLCGEKFLLLTKVQYLSGSPPPMRGKVPLAYRGQGVFGITPAYAGKSPLGCRRPALSPGSPPPMRGKDL